MARVNIPLQALAAHGGGDDAVTWTAADATNDHSLDNSSGKVLLLVRNDAASPNATITVVSVADEYGRTGDKTITCPAIASSMPGLSVYGPFAPGLFNQPGGLLNVDVVTATTLFFAAVKLP